MRNAVQEGRVAHAQLLLGAAGSGKLTLALALAQYLLCEQRTPDDSCGRCANCIKASKHIHPDLHYSYPTVGGKAKSTQYLKEWREALDDNPYLDANDWLQRLGAENRQGNITKDECDDIVRKLSLKTFEGRYKILLMWRPEYLGQQGNRLLKLIEEPPENTVFLLVAEQAEQILNTILSRCQLVQVHRPADSEIQAALMQRGLAPPRAQEIAHLADGDYNEAIRLIDSAQDDNAALFVEWLRKCYALKPAELVKYTQELAKLGRENQKQFLQYGLFFLREIMLVHAGSDTSRLPDGLRATAAKMSRLMDLDKLDALMQYLTDATYEIERNANPKILFLHYSIQIGQALRRKVVA